MAFLSNLFSKEHHIRLTVTSSSGFHLRPIAQFVIEAKKFPCEITASFKGKSVNAKKVNTLLSFALEQNSHFELIAKGKQAKEAIEKLETIFKTLMKKDAPLLQKKEEKNPYSHNVIKGNSIYEGISIAPLYYYKTKQIKRDTNTTIEEAYKKVLKELNSDKTNDIYMAQKELLLSIFQNISTFEDFEKKIKEETNRLKNTSLQSKITDYKDLHNRIQKHRGIEVEMITPSTPFVLFANDLLPSQIEVLADLSTLKGVILKETSLNSHTAILLRARGIISMVANLSTVQERTPLIVDSFASVVVTSASKKNLKLAKQRQHKHQKNQTVAYENRFKNATTLQNQNIQVLANVADVSSAKEAKEEGAEGIGLLRTEFLFKEEKPTLKEQINAYTEIFALFNTITVRTLDIGGDKALPYIHLPHEDNPFLGIRGVRLIQTHPKVIEEQLHAIFKASNNKPIKIMFPMISAIEEFKNAKQFAQNVAKKHTLNIEHISFGIMIEVPSVLFLIEQFNEVVDFYSIGTNDLTQYLFAIERTHPSLKVDELSDVVFSAIDTILSKATKPVSICGELASNKKAIKRLINLNLTILSVSPKSVSQTKEAIRKI